MFDQTFSAVIDRLIKLVEHKESRRQAYFSQHVAPMFQEIERVHVDYRDGIAELIRIFKDTRDTRILLPHFEERRAKHEHERILLFSQAVEYAKGNHIPPSARTFSLACLSYFQGRDIESLREQLKDCDYHFGYSGANTQICKILWQQRHEESPFYTDEETYPFLITRLDGYMTELKMRWERVCQAYAKAKVDLMR